MQSVAQLLRRTVSDERWEGERLLSSPSSELKRRANNFAFVIVEFDVVAVVAAPDPKYVLRSNRSLSASLSLALSLSLLFLLSWLMQQTRYVW